MQKLKTFSSSLPIVQGLVNFKSQIDNFNEALEIWAKKDKIKSYTILNGSQSVLPSLLITTIFVSYES